MKLNVGDVLVRFGKILQVSNVKTDIIELKPFFEARSNNGLIYSIQTQNLESGKIRKLVTKDKLKQLWENILNSDTISAQVNVIESRTALNLDELDASLQLIKTLWLEKQAHAGYLPGGRLSLFQQALSQATEEIAAVKGIKPDDAKLLVLSALKKRQNHVPPTPSASA